MRREEHYSGRQILTIVITTERKARFRLRVAGVGVLSLRKLRTEALFPLEPSPEVSHAVDGFVLGQNDAQPMGLSFPIPAARSSAKLKVTYNQVYSAFDTSAETFAR